MMSHEFTPHIDNDPRATELRSLLVEATSSLTPNSHYGLKLFGIKAPDSLQNQLQSQFRLPVDSERGINIDLGYDVLEQAFCVKSLACSLSKGTGRGILYSTESLGFIPSREKKQGMKFMPEEGHLPLLPWRSNEILEKLDIYKPPIRSVGEYAIWRSGLLGRTEGWVLQEYAEYLESVGDSHVQKVRISNEERVSDSIATSSKTQGVERIIDTITDEFVNNSIHAAIELESTGANQSLYSYHYLSKTERDPFILSHITTDTSNKEVLDIKDDDNFFSYRNMLESTLEYIKQERSL